LDFKTAAGCSVLLGFAALPLCAHGQLTPADFARALDLQEHYRGLIDHLPDNPEWIEGTSRFVYRETLRATPGEKENGSRFVVVDAAAGKTEPAFDQQRLADALSKALGPKVEPAHLPFTRFHFEDHEKSIVFDARGAHWTCRVDDYTCIKKVEDRDPDDEGYDPTPKPENGDEHPVKSPDGKFQAYVLNNNLVVRRLEQNEGSKTEKSTQEKDKNEPVVLSMEGSADNYYAVSSIAWSPDAKYVAAYRIRPGYRRIVDYVESSPPNQLQPIHSTMVYPKPGDVLAFYQPVLFEVATRKRTEIDSSLFPNQFSMSSIEWRKDSRGFTFEYNQRGHQLYRVVEVEASTGKARALIDETNATFVNYEPLERNQYDHGKYFRRDLEDGKLIMMEVSADVSEQI
jgi:hypothetical protein